MIRHAIIEGGLLLRRRLVLSAILAVSLAIPVTLSGCAAAVSLWLRPLIDMESESIPVPVLLHPRMDQPQRATWLAEQRERHPAWTFEEITSEALEERLTTWFPYLGDLFRTEEPVRLPVLVEVWSPQPEAIRELLRGPAVIAVGPTSSVHRLLGSAARLAVVATGGLSLVLLFSAVVLAATWVHLEIYRHAEEIGVMRLVGATEATIRSPFLLVMAVVGAAAGLISVAGMWLLVGWIDTALMGIGLPGLSVGPGVVGAQLGLCVLAPVAAAFVTLAVHARRHEKGAR
jgi:cell division protein FtsX